MTEHTHLPWHLGMKPGPAVYGPQGELVVMMHNPLIDYQENLANAAHIVKCVNAHDDLEDAVRYSLGILQEVYETIDADQNDPNGIYADIGTAIDKCNMALDTLAKVKGA